MKKMMKHQELTSKNHEASMRNLERQIGQLSKQTVAERAPNVLPSDTIPNPKEECKAIQLSSGRTLENGKETNKRPTENGEASSKKEVTLNEKNQEKPKEKEQEKLKEKKEQPQASKKGKQIMEEQSQEQRKEVKPYTPLLPYPQRFQKETKDQQFSKFLEVFKKLEINIPLAKALEQMPLLSIEEVKPTRMSLQLADRSLILPTGVVENLLVKVGEFIFPTDLVILDKEEEGHNSIILGRPFLATARAIIDAEKGEMTLRVHDEKMIINVFKAMQYPHEKEKHMRVEMVEEVERGLLEASNQEEQEEKTEVEQDFTEEEVVEISSEGKTEEKPKQELNPLPRHLNLGLDD
ncbi:glutamic acid-rich protein-like [Arachis ipaensis]|uniref:glutamic acid-rich protein-like n=1 Tax=Arachis ipaensis TaxID=130454 RepID=UPI0007AF5B9E|nr:glutamic acid-rich protein-like [Arachis ipaensis]